MARKISDTSRLDYEKIMQGRDYHYKKIILAVEWLVEGNNWQIAVQAKMKPEQVWKRTGELCKPDENGVSCLIDTGKRNLNPDGNLAIIYGFYENRVNYKPPESYKPTDTSAADIACSIIAKSEKHKEEKEKIIAQRQMDLFGN